MSARAARRDPVPLRRIVRLCHLPSDDARDRYLAAAIALVYALVLASTVGDLGYARDEGFYFDAAASYERWFRLLWHEPGLALSRTAVDAHWAHNHEHPALVKSLFALSHLLWRLWPFALEGSSYRFPAMLLSGMAVGLCYLWGTRAIGRLAGLTAALSLAAMPHFFFHAHLACFDAPVVAMWTLCAYAWWRALGRGGIARALSVGVTFGLALNTKHNSWFLPIVCGLHALFTIAFGLAHGIDRRTLLRRAVAALGCMVVVGPLLFYATWPWIWHDTVARLRAYAEFHLHHVYYNMEYFGRTYWRPPMPRSYAFVMTAATVPLTTLAVFVVGLVARLRQSLAPFWAPAAARPRADALRCDAATTLLWVLAIAVQYGAWLSPTTPIFGGTKHWMTAYPFVVLLGGAGARVLVRALWRSAARSPWRRPLVAEGLVVVALALPPVVQAAHSHPWGLSSYSALVGGAPGAASLGLNRGFWGYTTGALAPYLNALPKGTRIYIHDTASPAWEMLVRDGRVRADLVAVGRVSDADVSLYHHEQHMGTEEYQAWIVFGTTAPDHIAGLDGVPIVWTYRRRE
jgi:4-amino-4-deoxy-L-arabinose transferase-like glycosyltransferase